MKGLLKLFGLFFIVFLLLGFFILGYTGLIPGLSKFFGSDQPRNLGIKYTPQDLDSAQNKLKQTVTEAASSTENFNTLTGIPVETVLTSEEYSAHVELLHPLSAVQIKLSGSNFEMSGRIDKARIPQYVRTWGLTNASDTEILNIADKYLPGNPVFYLSGSGSVKNDDMTINLTKAELGRLPVPTDQAEKVIELISETLFQQLAGFSAESTTIENGQLHFKGTSLPRVPKY